MLSMNRHERRAAASKDKAGSKAVNAGAPAALHAAALQHMRAGQHLDAQRCCERILARNPGHVDTLQLMGLLSLQARHYDDAIEWIGRADREDPQAGYLISLGTALDQQGLHEKALKALDAAVTHKPDDAELWTRRADLLVTLQQPAEALAGFEHALTLSPRYWSAANNCAALLLSLDRFEDALLKLDLCDALQPDHAPTILARASTLFGLKRFEEAVAEGKRAQALDPTNADICNGIGVALQKLTRYDDALEQFEQALALKQDFAAALHNKASTLGELHRFDEAVIAYGEMKKLDPDDAEADWNMSLLQLLRGDLEAGWRGREERWRIPSLPGTAGYPKFSQPMWRGERNIQGKTILVCADEGLGDTIQFVRYVPMLAALGARVVLLPQESLHSLLAGLPGVSQCLHDMRGGLPAFDFHCPIMSLPWAFATKLDTIPAAASYLPRPAEVGVRSFEDRLGPHDRLRVGLVWSGNSSHHNDHNRSLPLRALSRILEADATFVSLQKDVRPGDQAALHEHTGIIDLAEHLTDFAKTAALIGCLDLVIAVDTSVAHLAAALGCPTWIVLPSVPDWRWLLDRDDSPWYPTVRLFRRSEPQGFGEVMTRVRSELDALIARTEHRGNAVGSIPIFGR
jgi:tetratricopeptide (TPR) repeat protein